LLKLGELFLVRNALLHHFLELRGYQFQEALDLGFRISAKGGLESPLPDVERGDVHGLEYRGTAVLGEYAPGELGALGWVNVG
jgi:hypothetical protein